MDRRLLKLEEEVHDLKLTIRKQKGIRERRCAVIGGFTPKGGVAIIANQLCIVARTLVSAKSELSAAPVDGDYAHPSAFMVNGMLVSAATSLQNVLEAVASLCHYLQPDSDHQGFVYFSTYPFSVSVPEPHTAAPAAADLHGLSITWPL
eukprot:gene17248-23572_t